MAEKVQKNYSTKGATGKRVAAIIFWVLALACELVAIMNLSGKWYLPNAIPALPDNYLLYLIIFLVLDLIFLIIGSQFWKKANRIDPASKKNKVLFFLQNQLGFFMAILCFLPFIIILLTKKDEDLKIDPKQKTIVAIVAIAALVIGGLASWDWNPISAEEKSAACEDLKSETIYVTQYGHCYHWYQDCQSLTKSNTITDVAEADWYKDAVAASENGMSMIEAAINKGYTKECSFCATKAAEALNPAGE